MEVKDGAEVIIGNLQEDLTFLGTATVKAEDGQKIIVYGSILLLIIVIFIFSYGMGQLSTIGVGSICGEGSLDVNIPYSADYVDISASWCMAVGFYLCIISIIALFIPRILIKRLHWGKE